MSIGVMKRTRESSPQFQARIAGVFYLLTIVTAMFAISVLGRLVVDNDAATTATNILAHESLFRLGFAGFLIGYLIFRSNFLPRILGILVAFAGIGHLTGTFANLLSPVFAQHLLPYIMLPGLVGEVSLMLWLLVMGVNASKWKEQATVAMEA